MAKKKAASKVAEERAEERAEQTSPEASRESVYDADVELRRAQAKKARADEELLAAQKKQEEERAAFLAKRDREISLQNRDDTSNPTVSVIVQTKRERPVRLPRGLIESRRPVKVTKRELRRLQGMSRRGHIELIVGELLPPGKLLERPGRSEVPTLVQEMKADKEAS